MRYSGGEPSVAFMTWLRRRLTAIIDRLGSQPACTHAAVDFGIRG
ncbi:hypothetical protein NY08_4540 [Rhodococcus sp. B7740]|nr:hypothetical protein NY08_4540 [Rhodococcus sp. B7740]